MKLRLDLLLTVGLERENVDTENVKVYTSVA
jgi:hypothetical protein